MLFKDFQDFQIFVLAGGIKPLNHDKTLKSKQPKPQNTSNNPEPETTPKPNTTLNPEQPCTLNKKKLLKKINQTLKP